MYAVKYRMTVEQNVTIAKRNIVDYIWKSAKLEGLTVTFPQTEEIFEGGIINGIPRDEVIAVNNLKHAWQFLFETLEYPMDYAYLCHLNHVVGSNLFYRSGYIRQVPVRIGGTKWTPEMPIESAIREEMTEILHNDNPTDRALTLMLWAMRRQMFLDGNKRTAMLAANQILIQNGGGIISIPVELQDQFRRKLIQFYETNEMDLIKKFLYEECIDGIDFPEQEPEPYEDYWKPRSGGNAH